MSGKSKRTDLEITRTPNGMASPCFIGKCDFGLDKLPVSNIVRLSSSFCLVSTFWFGGCTYAVCRR